MDQEVHSYDRKGKHPNITWPTCDNLTDPLPQMGKFSSDRAIMDYALECWVRTFIQP